MTNQIFKLELSEHLDQISFDENIDTPEFKRFKRCQTNTEVKNIIEIKMTKTKEIESKKGAARKSKKVELQIANEARRIKDAETAKEYKTVKKSLEIEEKKIQKLILVKNKGSNTSPSWRIELRPSSSSTSTSQQTKNVLDENERNDGINECDRDYHSSECIENEISVKTKNNSSSSFKHMTSIETMSTPMLESKDKSKVIIPKATVGVKKRVTPSAHLQHKAKLAGC